VRIVSSAPTRIDLAGGTIDIWPLYLFHDGATTVNLAISLRAHAQLESRTDGRVELRSIDTDRIVTADRSSALDGGGELSLLALLARHYGLENATLTTRGESPAGAGIAGSSALTIAVCGALARWSGQSGDADALLQVAMNVECQAIRVPTGVQDYRPALYGGVAAIELRVEGIKRVGIDVDAAELERRIVLAYTGAPRHSGTNNWGNHPAPHRRRPAHLRLLRADPRHRGGDARGACSAGIGTKSAGRSPIEWDNRKRLAPGVTTPTIESLIARATAAGATGAKVCGAGGGGCLFCYGPPKAREAIAEALAAGGRATSGLPRRG
jgi:D-glycero-alpha-D-manno-heptose-7-phosphate kinase